MQAVVKVIHVVHRDPESLERLKKKITREALVWDHLHHRHVTPFWGICYDQGYGPVPSLVCPYFKNGDLLYYLKTHQNVDRMALVRQAAAGLEYMHRHRVVHGDIKAANILINDNFEACLSDFGLSRILDVSGFTTNAMAGTFRWMAQELLRTNGADDEDRTPRVTTASDIWAFAMTVLEILTTRLPYCDVRSDVAVLLAVNEGARPARHSYPEISDDIWDILQACWVADPDLRPAMSTLLPDLVRGRRQRRRSASASLCRALKLFLRRVRAMGNRKRRA
ncbi:hypothetical protein PLICRDRAFT_621516 [Plicaturopsis crispa FD-325 SS-3]|nr:hypothetical protein PLICRDRAFT_621516 [Plicaturopsis crispa FD-325 SS-3]